MCNSCITQQHSYISVITTRETIYRQKNTEQHLAEGSETEQS